MTKMAVSKWSDMIYLLVLLSSPYSGPNQQRYIFTDNFNEVKNLKFEQLNIRELLEYLSNTLSPSIVS